MTTRRQSLAESVARSLEKIQSGAKWTEDFAYAFGTDIIDDLPPIKMLKAVSPNNPALSDFEEPKPKTEDELKRSAGEFANALGELPGFMVGGSSRVAKEIPHFIKGAVGVEKELTKRLIKQFPSLGKSLRVESGAALSNVPKVKLESINPQKVGKAKALIEQAGGTKIKVNDGGVASWIDAAGQKRTANLNERFGPRNVGLSDRDLRNNPRALDEDIINPARGEERETLRANKDDIMSRVRDAVKSEGRHSADAGGTSIEEINRAGKFYKMGRSGEPTYLGKSVDAGQLKPGEAVIQVNNGKASIYQGSGKPEALERFNRTQTGRDAAITSGKKLGELPGFESEQGAVGTNVGKKKAKKRQTITSTQVPEVDIKKFKTTNKVGTKNISFASSFDRAAYNLALKNDPKMMAAIKKQTGFSKDTILQHGFRIKNRVDKHVATGTPIKLKPRSVQNIQDVVEPTLNPFNKSFKLGDATKHAAKSALGLPSEFKFALDLPAMRQSFRPVVTHPIKTGIPAFKRALKAIPEKGYREQLEKLIEEEPIYDILDTATALGPAKAKQAFPNIEQLQKLGGTKHDVYDYFTSGTLGEKIPGLGEIPKVSKRMFDVFQRSVRGTESSRLADKLGKSMQELATTGDENLPAMIRSVNERSGFGPVGPFEPAMEGLSYIFNAPRNTMAGVQTWNPLNYVPENALPEFITKAGFGGRYGKDLSSPIYQDYLKDAAKMAAGYGAAAYGIDKLSSDDVEMSLDPLDTNVGLNVGNYRPDIFGGGKGFPTTVAKMAQPILSEMDVLDDKAGTSSVDKPMNFKPGKELEKFFRYRLKPGLAAMTGDISLGSNPDTEAFENAIGEDISSPLDLPGEELDDIPYSRWIANQFTPAWPEDVAETFQNSGAPQGIASILLGGAGMGGGAYDPFNRDQQHRAPHKYIRIKKRPRKPLDPEAAIR